MCVGAGRMCTMPKAFPKEFREDVIRVYKDSDASVAQVAKDFGIWPSCLKRWLTIDERKSSSSTTSNDSSAIQMRSVKRTSGSTCSSMEDHCPGRRRIGSCSCGRQRRTAAVGIRYAVKLAAHPAGG
jgi:transposase-like protein